jgi:hypothetical protein
MTIGQRERKLTSYNASLVKTLGVLISRCILKMIFARIYDQLLLTLAYQCR